MNTKSFLASALITGLTAGIAQAAPSYFFNDPVTSRTAFQTSFGASLTKESFETDTVNGFQTLNYAGFTVTSSGATMQSTSASRFVTDGNLALFTDEGTTTQSYTFTFDQEITAFGIDVNDLSYGSMTFRDNLGNVNGNVLLPDNGGPVGGPGFTNLQFFGVINSSGFTSVTLEINAGTNSGGIGFDNLEFSPLTATAVAEPLSLALLVLGAIGTGLAGSRRRKG